MTHPWSPRRDGLSLLGLIALAVVLPLGVGLIAGSLDIPRNDDWSYRSIALHLYETGRLALDGAAETLLVGQIFFVQPFLWAAGGGSSAFWVAGVAFDTIGIVAAYLLARRLLPPQQAVLAAALLPLFPGYLAYATSFMTDLPAAAMSFACLLMGMVAVGRRPVSIPWLIGALVIGCFAFSIRQFAIAAPVSVIVAAIVSEPRRWRHWVGAMILVAVCVAIAYGRSRLSGQLGEPLPNPGALSRIRASMISIEFVLLPAAIVGAVLWRRRWRLRDVAIGLEIGALVVAVWVFESMPGGPVPATLQNLASPWGVPAPGYLTGGRPLLFSDAIWAAVNGIALVAAVCVPAVAAGILGARLRRGSMDPLSILRHVGSPAGILVLFSAASAMGLFLFGLRWSIYDRYLWVLIPPLATLLMYVPLEIGESDRTETGPIAPAVRVARSAPYRFLLVGPLIILGGMSLAYLLNSHAFDAARWRAGEALVAGGAPATSVDAGYEWMGTYAPGLPQFAERTARATGRTFYSELWPGFRLCALVSSIPVSIPEAELVAVDEAAYRLLLIAGPDAPLYSYRIQAPGCGPP